MKIKKYLVTFGAAAAMVAPTFLSSVVANADAVQPQRQQQGHKQDNAKAAKQVGGKNLSQQPRETGSQYTNDNSGYNVTVKATNLINTLHYNVKTSTDSGASSADPFSISIYKDGELYKTISSSTGTLSGSLWVGSGTYSIKVYTSSAASHWTGGLATS
ncbi:hypothetical protein [Lentilactobacillus buchneri]|uniref:Uncharacterized protein n=1 Tax=Lentilactobacillus buchneri DSM 20057 TaxID=1423728 RepID=A0A4R5NRP0_LENBU|nr:hypothetical protein [Lentilactobacillus buchneri]WCJ50870.1 hypothetical protein OKF32_06005 [Lentilactobacillus sp. Egmn17]KRK68751.1 hypothetical protein FC79_GL000297 [Lentilactobacillus buchneri DSM 20057]MCT3251875.1 hypothetical protein [Lentilactobacillus buchneri]MCT3546463.1 hypothetical protein [Lentilactobacillus buchneri]MCT3554343.1 hypothetical protein [Lentilactobacillus buchneri]